MTEDRPRESVLRTEPYEPPASPDEPTRDEGEFKSVKAIEDTIDGLARLFGSILSTSVMLLTRPGEIVNYLDSADSRSAVARPLSYLAITTFLGIIGLRAFPSVHSLFQQQILSTYRKSFTDLSVYNLVLMTLPIILFVQIVGRAAGWFLGLISDFKPKDALKLTCYAAGFQFLLLCLMTVALIPLTLFLRATWFEDLRRPPLEANQASTDHLEMAISVTFLVLAIYILLSAAPILYAAVRRRTGIRGWRRWLLLIPGCGLFSILILFSGRFGARLPNMLGRWAQFEETLHEVPIEKTPWYVLYSSTNDDSYAPLLEVMLANPEDRPFTLRKGPIKLSYSRPFHPGERSVKGFALLATVTAWSGSADAPTLTIKPGEAEWMKVTAKLDGEAHRVLEKASFRTGSPSREILGPLLAGRLSLAVPLVPLRSVNRRPMRERIEYSVQGRRYSVNDFQEDSEEDLFREE